MTNPLPRFQGLTPPRLFDVEKAMPGLAEYRRSALRLRPERVKKPLPVNASKIGGRFLWPSKEAWPFCRETDPVEKVGEYTLQQALEHAREMKLGEKIKLKPPPSGPNNFAALEKWNRDFEAEYKKLRAGGLPELTPAEIAETKKQYDEQRRSSAEAGNPHNAGYFPLIQLRRDDFPELPWPHGKDLLQVLWCPRVHFRGNRLPEPGEKLPQTNGAKIYWRTESAMRPAAELEAVKYKGFAIRECRLRPEEIVEYPQGEELGPDTMRSLKNLKPWFDRAPQARAAARHGDDPGPEWRYSYDIATAPGTKLLGYAQWIQDPELPGCACGAAMEPLLTLASQEDADSTIWHVETMGKHDEAVENPSGFHWGDWSNAYVFYCARRHAIRTRTIVQSS